MRRVYKKFIVEPNEKANLITEAFGIDAGYENVVADLEIPTDYEIMYITGESGSGKTTILNEIVKIEEMTIPKEPLFEWGKNQKETLGILTLVGLGDAVLYLSTYEKLSDSQKARARVALELLSDKEEIYIDEFLSTLDRKTAKAVAYCIQKAIRKLGKKAILVTAHNDLEGYLMPDVVIEGKAFPSRWEIKYNQVNDKNLILEECSFEYVDKVFYRNLRLGELHYKGKYTGGTKEYLAVLLDDDCIGILVSTNRMHDDGRRIARVVIHPSYRGCGIGTALVREYLRSFPKTDVIAAMALFNPIFEKAGMDRVNDVQIKPPTGLKKELLRLNFDIDKWFSKTYCNEFTTSLENRELLSKYAKNATHLVCPGGKYLDVSEIEEKIENDSITASRVLWGLRPRKMAKYVGKRDLI